MSATSATSATPATQSVTDWVTKIVLSIIALMLTGLLSWVVKTTLSNTVEIVTLKALYKEQQLLTKKQGEDFNKQMLTVAGKLDNVANQLQAVSNSMLPRDSAEMRYKAIERSIDPLIFDYRVRELTGNTATAKGDN
ncbi:TM Helix protein [Vibrio phage LV6]|nr:TM Helix protein [Vibrio phage LV6]